MDLRGGYGRVFGRHYAKVAGYLLGDRVSVANPAAKVMVYVLILGALDGEGILILLSPESVKNLRYKRVLVARTAYETFGLF